MRSMRSMVMALGVAALMVGPLVAAGNAQGGSGTGSDERPAQGMAGEQPAAPTMSIDEMMERMNSLMGTMTGMMGSGQGMGMSGGMMGGQGSQMGYGMMDMTQSVDQLGQSMNDVMLQMRDVMRDQQLMAQPGITEQMHRMQGNMGTMLNGYQNMVHDLQQMRTQGGDRPSR